MKIDINKDFETEFKSEFFKGFTLRETVLAFAGMGLALLIAFLVWYFAGIPVQAAIYFGIPVIALVCAVGFFTPQGQTLSGMFREIRYYRKTRNLTYEASELPKGSGRVFFIHRQTTRKKRRRR